MATATKVERDPRSKYPGASITLVLQPKDLLNPKRGGARYGNNMPGEPCGFPPEIAHELVAEHGATYRYTPEEVTLQIKGDTKRAKAEESRLDRLERENNELHAKLDNVLALLGEALTPKE